MPCARLCARGRANRLYLAKDAKVREKLALVDLIPYDFVPLAGPTNWTA